MKRRKTKNHFEPMSAAEQNEKTGKYIRETVKRAYTGPDGKLRIPHIDSLRPSFR